MFGTIKLVEVEIIKEWYDNHSAVIVDVREEQEYLNYHIKGSILSPLSRFSYSHFPKVPPDKKLVIHCRSGIRCGTTANHLMSYGFKVDVHRMIGGILAWKEAGYPIVTP